MPAPSTDDGVLADERRAVAAFKKTALMVLGLAMQTFGTKLTDEQEVLMHLADILIDVFSAESAVLRAQAAAAGKAPKAVAARGRGAGVRQRRGAADRRVGAPGARRHGRRRHAAHDAGGAAPAAEGDARSTRSRCAGASPTRPSRARRLSASRRSGGSGWGSGQVGQDGSGSRGWQRCEERASGSRASALRDWTSPTRCRVLGKPGCVRS